MSEYQLVLERYEPIKILEQKNDKNIVLLKNRNTSQLVVGKFQSQNMLRNTGVRNVLHEANFLQSMQGYPGIPIMYWSGKTINSQIVLIQQYLGDKLSKRMKVSGGILSIKSVCMLGIQMIQLIHSLHDKGYIHRNIKMKTFQFGRGDKCNNLFINNFLECKHYRDNKNMTYLLKEKKVVYSSLSIFDSMAGFHGMEKSRKDDLESLVLLMVYLMKGQLPWSKNKKMTKITYQEINKNNQYVDESKICQGIPKSFEDMLKDARTLGFQQQPNYHWYILKLKSVLFQIGEQYDFVYDWLLIKHTREKNKISNLLPSISLEEDDAFLKQLEQTYFDAIDLNEVEKKHELLLSKMRRIQQASIQQIQMIKNKNKQPMKEMQRQHKLRKQPKKENCSLM